MTRTPTDYDEIRLNNARAASDLALSSGIVYRDGTGRVVVDDPSILAAPTAPSPERFEPAREFGPRRIPGPVTGFDGNTPDEHAWQTTWADDGERPWWVQEYAAELVEQDRQQVMRDHSPYYVREFDPPVDDEEAAVIYRSTPETADFIQRARQQGMP